MRVDLDKIARQVERIKAGLPPEEQSESPIESRLLTAMREAVSGGIDRIALLHDCSGRPWRVTHLENGCPDAPDPHSQFGSGEPDLATGGRHTRWLYTGVLIESYKLDILLQGPYSFLAIECDGHDWHDRTKQQAAYDRARDREILLLGIPTIRFTGSEIHHDVHRCAVEAFAISTELERRRRLEFLGRIAEIGERTEVKL